MNELIEFHETRSGIAASVMVSVHKHTKNDGIRRLVYLALGHPFGYDAWKRGVQAVTRVRKDCIKDFFGAVVDIENEFDGYHPAASMDEIMAEIVVPVSDALNEKTGIPLGARDIGEAIPYQQPLPQWCLDRGWDITDVEPYRYPPLMRRDVRLYAYPLIHAILTRNKEWFPVEYFLQKNAYDYKGPPRQTILRDIFSDASGVLEEDTYCKGKSGKYLLDYLAPELWPPAQRRDKLAVFQAVKDMHKDIVMKNEVKHATLPFDFIFNPRNESYLIRLIELYMNVMNDAMRPGANLRVVSTMPRPKAP